MVSALRAMEWGVEVVGTWAAAKALPVDSRLGVAYSFHGLHDSI
jgi:hypothetical protein